MNHLQHCVAPYDIIKEMYEYICIVHEIPTFKLLYFF